MDAASRQFQTQPGRHDAPLAAPQGIGPTIGEALEFLNAAHERLEMIEERVFGSQPRAGVEQKATMAAPSSLTDVAMRVRTGVMTLNDRLDRLNAAI